MKLRLQSVIASALLTAVLAITPASRVLAQEDLEAIYHESETPPDPPSDEAANRTRSVAPAENRKLDPALQRLLQTRSQEPQLAGSRLALRVYLHEARDVSAIRTKVQQLGGEVTAAVGIVVLVRMPFGRVDELSRSEEISRLSLQVAIKPQGAAGDAMSSGVEAIFAKQLHERGVLGVGINVGIIDLGFQGYSELQRRGRLPRSLSDVAFNDTGRMEDGGPHGTAVAEVIHAVAPGAGIYRAVIGTGKGEATEDQFVRAARWMVNEGVRIINFSGGSYSGPSDDRDLLAQVVNETSSQGVIWIVAAGNAARMHWMGPAVDANGDSWIDIGAEGKGFVLVRALASRLRILVKWDDWPSSDTTSRSREDLDAYLFSFDPITRKFQYVARSDRRQTGDAEPVELIDTPATAGQIYGVSLRPVHVTRPVRIDLFNEEPVELYPYVTEGSILSPALATQALGVGAIDLATGQLDPDSSRGTANPGGAVKPEVTAPAGVVSAVYPRGELFDGTSSAAPHVTGLAVLLQEISPRVHGQALRAQIVALGPFVQAGRLAQLGPSNPLFHVISAREVTYDPDQLDGLLRAGLVADPTIDLKIRSDREDDQYRPGGKIKAGLGSSTALDCSMLRRSPSGVYSPFSASLSTVEVRESIAIPSGVDVWEHVANQEGYWDLIAFCREGDSAEGSGASLTATMWRIRVGR